MTQEPDPTTPDPVAYLKAWIRGAKDRIKATRETTQDQVATPPPNQAQLV